MTVEGKKALVVCWGSRGDCQPYIALCLGLKEAGFDCTVLTCSDHEALVKDIGATFVSNEINFKKFFTSKETVATTTANDFIAYLGEVGKLDKQTKGTLYRIYYKLLESTKPDIVLLGTSHQCDCLWIPMILRIPCLPVNLSMEQVMRSDKAPVGLPTLPFNLNGLYQKLAQPLVADVAKESWGGVIEELSGKPVDDWMFTGNDLSALFDSKGFLLPEIPDEFQAFPYIVAMDEDVFGKIPLGTARTKYGGLLTLPEERCQGSEFGGSKAAALESFITAGDKPVYIGWGSVSCNTPKWMTLLAVRSLKLAGKRGVVLGGWAGLKEELLEGEPDSSELLEYSKKNIFFTETASHEKLFPKFAVLVHHGGAGTTVTSLKSGNPVIITPIFYDQLGMAELVAKTGAGTTTEHLSKTTPEMLANKIKACLADSEMIKTAAEVAAKLRNKNGIKDTTDIIVTFLNEVNKDGDAGPYWQAVDSWTRKKKQANKGWLASLNCCSGPRDEKKVR